MTAHARRYISLGLVITLILTALAGCTPAAHGGELRLTILYTADEHGWMAGTDAHGGAASMLTHWREDEGYSPEAPFLVLSGGDTWTGPALSTWFDGESMIEVMNLMGYDAAAVGNHEFDFGLDGLRERGAQAEFPFLAANMRTAAGTEIDFALPYVVHEVTLERRSLKVGIIGLASTGTPRTTMPTHVAGLEFDDYATVLSEVVPQVRAEGAHVIVVIGHLCNHELNVLAPVAKDLGVAMLGGGHCHQQLAKVEDGLALVAAGWRLEAYVRVDLALDPATLEVTGVTAQLKPNSPVEGDAGVAETIARWQGHLDDELLVSIGYTEQGIERGSNAMHNLVMDAWLAAYPADVALSNPGGFRQDIEAGEITLATIVGVLPFDNTLVATTLTGDQLLRSYRHGTRQPAVGGLVREGSRFLVNGVPLDPAATYRVLVNDFMYAGGDGYRFAEYDPDAYMTGIDWRQPVIAWISKLNTSPGNPLDIYLDDTAR
jgi:5'-nucleotidase / UDP-sugar diphosphatase